MITRSIYIIPFLMLVLVFTEGCSSSPKQVEAPGSTDLTEVREQQMDSSPRPKAGTTTTTIPMAPVVTAAGVSPRSVLSDAIKSNNNEEVARVCFSLLSVNSKDIYALNALAVIYYKRGEFTAAQMMLERALKENSKSSDLYNNMGLVKLGMNESREAIKYFRKALTYNPNDSIAAANIGALYLREKEYGKGLIAMEIAAAKLKDNRVMMNYAIALVANRKFEKAEGIYQFLLRNTTSDLDIMFNYSILLIDHLGKNQEGLDLVNKVKFLGPSSEMKNKIVSLENKAKAGLK